MLKVGITGSIGVGKTTVCKIFETLFVPVFYADKESKKILFSNTEVKQNIRKKFGDSVFIKETRDIDKKVLSKLIFENEDFREYINSILHPLVNDAFKKWLLTKSKEKYVIKEAALFFEVGTVSEFDVMIGVESDEKLVKERLLNNRKLSEDVIMKVISSQIQNSIKMKLCDGVIRNNKNEYLLPQVLHFHQQFQN